MRWLFYPRLHNRSLLFYNMPKRKCTVTNPLSFKRQSVVCRKQTPTSYRWIGIDRSEKIIRLPIGVDPKVELEDRKEVDRVFQLTQEERKWRDKGYEVIVGVDEAVSNFVKLYVCN